MEDASFQPIVDDVLQSTGASRVTLRINRPDAFFPVVAEALAPGIRSLKGDAPSPEVRNAPTFKFIEKKREILVQDDVLDTEYPLAPDLQRRMFDVRAQMVAPLVASDELVGTVNVHHSGSPRKWTSEDVAALREAVRRAEAMLGENGE